MEAVLKVIRWAIEQNPEHRSGLKLQEITPEDLWILAKNEHELFGQSIATQKPDLYKFADKLIADLSQIPINGWNTKELEKIIIYKLLAHLKWTEEQKEHLIKAIEELDKSR